jgi:fatty-acyl-CoA synthase
MRAPYSRVLPDLVDEVAARAPDRPAVITGEASLSYRDVSRAGARIASGLAALGVRRHDRVGLLCSNRPEWIFAMLGATRLGAELAAFDTWSRAWDLEHLLENSNATVLVTLDELRGRDYVGELCKLIPELDAADPGAWSSRRFPGLRDVIVVGDRVPRGARRLDALPASADAPRRPPGEHASAGDVALVLYTSGSTARPKGVPLLHHAAIENGFGIGERMGLHEDDRVWVSVPLFWSYGSANALMATMTHGATVVLQEVFEPAEALDLIECHRCTAAYTLPNITARLTTHPAFDRRRTASLRTGLTLGTPEDIRRAAETLGIAGICNIYGSTETYGNCAVTPTELPLEVRMSCQGPPLPGATIRIVDPETGVDRLTGEQGEIWVSGFVTPGYVGNAALSAKTFTPDGFYRSGDAGFLDEEGRLHFVGRESEMIKTGGINVSPVEVEGFLMRHPGVRNAAVIGRPHEERGEIAVAFVELGETAEPERLVRELVAACRAEMASYKAPQEIHVIGELPKTGTGKLDRRALRDRAGTSTRREIGG